MDEWALRWPEPALSDGKISARPWRAPDDVAAVFAASQDPSIPAMSSVPRGPSTRLAVEWIDRQHAKRHIGSAVCLAVTDRGDTAIGMVTVNGIDPDRACCALGYWVVPNARGRGVAGRAAALMTGWAWDALPLVRIEARITVDNVASRRAAERAGLSFEGVALASHRFGLVWADMAVYAAVRPGTPRISWAQLSGPARTTGRPTGSDRR